MSTIQRACTFLFTATIAASGCAGDLDDELGGDAVEEPAEGEVGPNANSEPREEGGQRTIIDATDDSTWVYFDLESGRQLEVDDPMEDIDWDLAFLRFNIATNGGISGEAGVEVAIVEAAFDEVTEAPADGYLVDEEDGDDVNEEPDYVFHEWYNYNFMTHILTPADITYVVQTGQGNAFKVAVENYYDEAGTSGIPTIIWAPL
ncbi:MAG: HmuY family protein [Myxococcota bacterium]